VTRRILFGVALAGALSSVPAARAQTPLAGHYPPGQSGIRGASSLPAGWGYTNFNRLFSNLDVTDPAGATVENPDEVRFANISMITWTTRSKVLGMTYGAVMGIPFSTGNLNPSTEDLGAESFGLGDVLVTPVSLYGRDGAFDYQFQLTVWTASGRFEPGSAKNRGSGFWALVYSVGGVANPGNDGRWSLSAIARFEQNFEQAETGITPGNDVVLDWGVGRRLRETRPIEAGISGFATWQLSHQSGGEPEAERLPKYRYFGAGPEGSLAVSDRWTLRLRAHWEFGARNVVEGNNLWFIANCRL
jgi:hypothetical protein